MAQPLQPCGKFESESDTSSSQISNGAPHLRQNSIEHRVELKQPHIESQIKDEEELIELSSTSSSSQPDISDMQQVIQLENKIETETDDELALDDLIPKCTQQIFELIAAQEDIETIKSKMETYNVLNHKHASEEEENDWNDFRYITDEEEDGVTLLEHAFNAGNYSFCAYLVTEMKLLPCIYCEHIIRKLISKIVKDLKEKHMSDKKVERLYHKVMKQMLSIMRPPTDRKFKDSYDLLKDLLVAAYSFESKFLCKVIKELLEETLADEECFVDSLRDKLDDILCIVRDRSTKCNDNYKREVWNVLFECIIYKKQHIDWLCAQTKHWEKWMFKDWQIFQIVLTKVDHFDEEYKRCNPNICDIQKLLWCIMNCNEKNKANTNGMILICNYIYDHYYKQSESFPALYEIIMGITSDTNFTKKAKQKYVSILFYFFINDETANDCENGIICFFIKKYITLDASDRQTIKAFEKMLYHIFILTMLRFSKRHKISVIDCFAHVTKEEKKVMNWCESLKIGEQTLKHVVQRTILRCLAVCAPAKRERFKQLHCNVIITFAAKLATFLQDVLKKNRQIDAQHVISQIFSDSDDAANEFNYATEHQLQTFIYQIAPNYFNTATLENVHVLFVNQSQQNVQLNEMKSEEMMDGEGRNQFHIHLMNVCIVSSMTPKQICQFVLSSLHVRYKTNTAYNSSNMTYDKLYYKLWNKSQWKPIKHNTSLRRHKKGAAHVLLITDIDNETTDVSLDIILSHIHQYALMSLKSGNEVFYFDEQQDGKKQSHWHRGRVKEIKPNEDKTVIEQITIENKDSNNGLFAKTKEDKYFFELLNAQNPCFEYIFPKKLQHWFPVTYFKEHNKKYAWQKPQFSFISSIITATDCHLFMGKIKQDNEDKYYGAMNIIAGDIPYPLDQFQFVKLEIASKLSFQVFVNQHLNKINDKCEDKQARFAWSVFVRWDQEKEYKHSMHHNLAADASKLNDIYCIQCKFCMMYILTAQHLQKIGKTKSINFDFLRYGRENSAATDCFILTVFETHFKYYSSLLNERFATVFLKDLRLRCPQDFAYRFADYTINQKKKKKNDKQAPSYSKQQRKQKAKKEAEELVKDWQKAMNKIKAWVKKNIKSVPKDTVAWESVIKSQIMKDLYPNFNGPKDVEVLAIRAASIDVSEIIKEIEAAKAASVSPKRKSASPKRKTSARKNSKLSSKDQHHRSHVRSGLQSQPSPAASVFHVVRREAPLQNPSNANNMHKNHHSSAAPPGLQYIPPQNKDNPMHSASFKPRCAPPEAMNDTQSIESMSTVAQHKINYDTQNIPVCAVKPTHIDAKCTKQQAFQLLRHSFLVGCASKNIKAGNETVEYFKNINKVCSEWGLCISCAKFVYVLNYEELRRYSQTIDNETLFLYVRFTSTEHAMNFREMCDIGFNVKVCIHKIKQSDVVQYRGYSNYSEAEMKEMSDLLSINGNGAKRNFDHLLDVIGKQMNPAFTQCYNQVMDDFSVAKQMWLKLPKPKAEVQVNEIINNGGYIAAAHNGHNVQMHNREIASDLMNEGHNIEMYDNDDDNNDWMQWIHAFQSLSQQPLNLSQALLTLSSIDFEKLAQKMSVVPVIKKENQMLKKQNKILKKQGLFGNQ